MALTRLVNDFKDSVKVASTGANIDLGAAPNTLDGVSLALNDRVLVKDNTPSYLNGIYRITTLGSGANGSWSRSSDFNDWREISPGAMVFVEAGSINGNAFYFINGGGSNVTINTTAINFSNLYSVNGNITSFPGNVNIAGTLNVTGNIVTKSYETVTLTEYANVQNVAGNINVTNGGNINIGAGGNIYMGSTAIPRYRSGNTSPSSPNLGDVWYQGNTDILYQYIQDANGYNYWFDISSNPSSYGNLTVANTLTLNGNLTLPVTSLILTGGTSGYVLRTDGNGGLSWVAVSATAGGSNSFVQFNDGGSLGGSTYIQYNKTSGNLVSNSTTTSTSTTTGAFVVGGGIGVGGNVSVGDTVTATNLTIKGAYANSYLTTYGSLFIDASSGNQQMQISTNNLANGIGMWTSGVANSYIYSSGGIEFLTGKTLRLSNYPTGGATYMVISSTGNVTMTAGTTSTSTATGTLVVTGGVGISGNVNANAFYSNYYVYSNGNPITTPAGGGNTMVQFNDGSNFAGATYIQYNKTSGNLVSNSTTTSISTTTGAFVVGGGLGVSGNIYSGNEYTSSVNINSAVGNYNVLNITGTALGPYGTQTWKFYTNNTALGSFGSWILFPDNSTQTTAYPGTSTTLSLSGTISSSILNAGTIGNTSSILYGATHSATSAFLPTANNAVSLANATNYMSSIYGVNYFIANVLAPIANAVTSFGTSSAMPLNEYGVNFYVANSILPITNVAPSIGSAQATFKNIYGVSFFGTSTTAKYADLAEMYHADDHYMPGTVMIFGGDLDVTNSKTSHDPRVAGIVSTNPAYLMNDNFEQDNWLPIALTGRVPCLVQGPVQKGDLLVTGNYDGVAQKLDKSKYEVGCIIGKSLDVITDDSIKKIEVAVGRY